ncbi:hypothetical protein C5S36_06220, partial [Candidatus Methanophagaceae archaeon]
EKRSLSCVPKPFNIGVCIFVTALDEMLYL